jgi:23S rRNA (cytidine1920-2'-O)/16S rRNA (cytidine1409-2'-O)-methyltransferase
MKQRLDHALVARKLVTSRSQAESYIRLGDVQVDGQVVTKPGFFVGDHNKIRLTAAEQYVSRAGLKLASVARQFDLDFKDAVVLDVGSSTGGFTDYALKNGARKVIAVDVGTQQLHATLRSNSKIELHEQTDIRSVTELSEKPSIVVIDVSFISLRQVLPHISRLVAADTDIVCMLKPQFEASDDVKHKGVIKNEAIRRNILKSFEQWAKERFIVLQKADSQVAGEKGNRERFYVLRKLSK